MALTTNLVAYWKLDGNSTDATGNGNNGTDTAITYGASYGKINQGADFNGSSSYINLGTGADLNITGALTISAWVYVASFSNYYFIVAKTVGNGGTSEAYEFRIENSTGYINFLTPNHNVISTSAITAGAWNHVVGVRDASSNTTLYINGVQVGTGTGGTPSSIASYPTYIGSRGDFYSYFNGYIDEVGIWNRALTSTEVSQLYNSGAGLQYPFSTTTTTPSPALLLAQMI